MYVIRHSMYVGLFMLPYESLSLSQNSTYTYLICRELKFIVSACQDDYIVIAASSFKLPYLVHFVLQYLKDILCLSCLPGDILILFCMLELEWYGTMQKVDYIFMLDLWSFMKSTNPQSYNELVALPFLH